MAVRTSRSKSFRSGCRPGRSRPNSSSSVAISDRLQRLPPGCARPAGDYLAVLAADLQEPPDLVLEFHRVLNSGEADVVMGHRIGRADPFWSQMLSDAFWRLYRRFVVHDMPKGGIDVFACTRAVRDQLVELKEANTNLIALLFWLGFRRAFIPYERRARLEGRSAWTFGRKLRYAIDSIFSFTDLPIRALLILGAVGTAFAIVAGVTVFVVLVARASPGARLHAADARHHVLRRPDRAGPRHHRPVHVAVAAERPEPPELHREKRTQLRSVRARSRDTVSPLR